jgi:hypothetical protein
MIVKVFFNFMPILFIERTLINSKGGEKMKISSYKMHQSAKHDFSRHEVTSFNAELIRVTKSNQQSLGPDVKQKDNKKALAEVQIAKNELLESLMAYLDRRHFEFKLVTDNKFSDDSSHDCDEPIITVPQPYRRQLRLTNVIETHEFESLHFTSTGQIETEDGQNYNFSYDLSLTREFYEKNTTKIQNGMIDPLVLNLDNEGVSFNSKKIHLDLDLDGNIDTFHMLNQGSGFLVLDKNKNGKVDDGSELFGPSTNDGFRELAEFDFDSNNWIDENDVVFNNLKVWTFDEDGKETLVDIKDSNIGAIYLE